MCEVYVCHIGEWYIWRAFKYIKSHCEFCWMYGRMCRLLSLMKLLPHLRGKFKRLPSKKLNQKKYRQTNCKNLSQIIVPHLLTYINICATRVVYYVIQTLWDCFALPSSFIFKLIFSVIFLGETWTMFFLIFISFLSGLIHICGEKLTSLYKTSLRCKLKKFRVIYS